MGGRSRTRCRRAAGVGDYRHIGVELLRLVSLAEDDNSSGHSALVAQRMGPHTLITRKRTSTIPLRHSDLVVNHFGKMVQKILETRNLRLGRSGLFT